MRISRNNFSRSNPRSIHLCEKYPWTPKAPRPRPDQRPTTDRTTRATSVHEREREADFFSYAEVVCCCFTISCLYSRRYVLLLKCVVLAHYHGSYHRYTTLWSSAVPRTVRCRGAETKSVLPVTATESEEHPKKLTAHFSNESSNAHNKRVAELWFPMLQAREIDFNVRKLK